MKKLLLALTLMFAANVCAEAASYVVLPKRFENSPILIRDSEEYKKIILENKDLAAQLEQEKLENEKFTKTITKQSWENYKVQSELVRDYQSAQLKISDQKVMLAKKDLTIVGLGITITLMIVGFVAALYFRVLRFGIGI
jgi:3-dehydroquinate synthetase